MDFHHQSIHNLFRRLCATFVTSCPWCPLLWGRSPPARGGRGGRWGRGWCLPRYPGSPGGFLSWSCAPRPWPRPVWTCADCARVPSDWGLRPELAHFAFNSQWKWLHWLRIRVVDIYLLTILWSRLTGISLQSALWRHLCEKRLIAEVKPQCKPKMKWHCRFLSAKQTCKSYCCVSVG